MIQYNLFQQKPVADYDKIRGNKYDISDVIAKCRRKMTKRYPTIAKKKFRDGNYNDPNRRYRKYHFLWGEFEKRLKNSCCVRAWVEREVTAEELDKCLSTLITECVETLLTLNEKQKMKYVNIPAKKNFCTFLRMSATQKLKLDYISYHYYKNYDKLVTDLARILGITSIEDTDSESD